MKEYKLKPLGPKMTIDTKLDLIKFSGVSKSQEALAAMLGIQSPKVGMSQCDWREANRLTPEGIAKTQRRVIGDVQQHMELRLALVEEDMLGPPKFWRP